VSKLGLTGRRPDRTPVPGTFLACGDTTTPVKASLTAVAVNVAFKVVLMGPLAQVGLALTTSIGACVNVALVVWFAWRARLLTRDSELFRAAARLAAAGLALALVLWAAEGACAALIADWTRLKDEALLAALALIGAAVYGGTVLTLYGHRLRALVRPPEEG
jgi:putative peptidoglycan lipid II flippase